MSDTQLVLIDLNSSDSFVFQFFPKEVKTVDRSNWEVQDTAGGKKPLFYANGEPQALTFSELYFDKTDTGESLKETLEKLRKFVLDVPADRGAPSALLAAWGDNSLRCVVRDLTVEQIFFNKDGRATRARVSLELIEIQDGTTAGVRVGT